MAATLDRLPVELFDIIVADLDLPASCNLRVSSRQLRLLSFSTFSKRYFSILKTTLGSASLNRLVNIATHPHLSNVVTALEIRLLSHLEYEVLTRISRAGVFPPPKRFPKVAGVKPEHINEEARLFNGISESDDLRCVVNRLTCALQGFDNLRIIRFCASQGAAPTDSQSLISERDQGFRTRCFQAVLKAIIDSEIDLHEFSMAKRSKRASLSYCADLQHGALQLPHHTLQALQLRFVNLGTLTVSMSARHGHDSRVPGWENGLSNIIAVAPSIQNLVLSLDHNDLGTRYSATVIRSLALSCRLSGLAYFHLASCWTHVEDLAAFIVAHAQSLGRLVFNGVCLLSGSWCSLWTSCKELKGLQWLRISSLEEAGNPIRFRLRGKDRQNIRLNSQKTRRSMSDMLEELIAAYHTEIEFPYDWL